MSGPHGKRRSNATSTTRMGAGGQVRAKRLSDQDIIGEKGIALIYRTVLDMGFVWNVTKVEAGIDGHIEIRDPATGIMTNLIVLVQSKATDQDFQGETEAGFDYYCDPRDVHYWLAGNAPVILVRSRPRTNEAYWVSIKDYFKDLATRTDYKVHFDKAKDMFGAGCGPLLFELAKPKDSGLFLSPPPKHEKLYSNLLPVAWFAEKIYIAETDFRRARDLGGKFREMGVAVGREWILRNKRIISFYDLERYPWREVCDLGTLEPFDTEEWSSSDDRDYLTEFQWLLNETLRSRLAPDIRYSIDRDFYYFAPTRDLKPRVYTYQSLVRGTKRTVFKGYYERKDGTGPSYYRHSAFEGRFVRHDSYWYLEITPRYHFTVDGHRPSPFAADNEAGIKRLELNAAVLGQVLMWADYLQDKVDLFTEPYPYLSFGSLLTFELDAGVNDDFWLRREEDQAAAAIQSSLEEELTLFRSMEPNAGGSGQ